nr:uncharacterized protein LOC131135466 isoform X2 [Doryrhamphus excisus]
MTMYVQQGKDQLFKVKDDVTLTDIFVWKFNKNDTIIRLIDNQPPKIYSCYETRFSLVRHFSLLINNVQASDTGVYTALLLGSPDQTLAEYHLQVQAAVSPVKLVVASVSTSDDLCNITATCATDNGRVNSTFRCDRDNCSEVEMRHSGATTLDLYLQAFFPNVSIVCNHSNKVSWTMDAKEVRDICVGESDKSSIANWIWIPVLAGLGLGFLSFLLYKWMTFRSQVKESRNRARNQHADRLESNHAILNACHVNDAANLSSTYALVEFHTAPQEHPMTDRISPETMYAKVMRAKPNVDTGSKFHQTIKPL